MAKDYANIGLVLANIADRERATESFSKGLKILQDLKEKTGYHHPLIDRIQGDISKLQEENDEGGKLE